MPFESVNVNVIDFYSNRLDENGLKSVANSLNDHFGTKDWTVIQAGKNDEVWDSFFQRVFCYTEYQTGDYRNLETIRVYAFRAFYGVNSLEQHLQNNQDVAKDNQIIQNNANNRNRGLLGLLGLLSLIGLVLAIPNQPTTTTPRKKLYL